jgi:hypothetical protein
MGNQRTRPWNAANAGASSVAEAEITFADAEQGVVDVPAGGVVMRVWAEILTAFNAGTTNVLKVGVTGTTGKYMDTADIAEGTPGVSDAFGPFAAEAAAVTVKAFFTQTGTAATTGKARVYVEYARMAANG